jgi:hypothetical protein
MPRVSILTCVLGVSLLSGSPSAQKPVPLGGSGKPTKPTTPTTPATPPTPTPPTTPAPGAPYAAAPLCDDHDKRTYHGLWNAAKRCHYDHHHGDNPRAVDDLFGTSLFSLLGGEVSHPWQTYSEAGYENDLKHAGYFWHVRRDMPCEGRGCVTSFRVLVHQHPTGRDAAVRHHSGVVEANVLDTETGRPGYVQVPGVWLDFGDLLVDGATVLDVEGNGNRHKQHSSAQSGSQPQLIWYGASQEEFDGRQGFVRVSTSIHDAWDFTNPRAPSATDDYVCWPATNCPANATLLRPHLITVSVPSTVRDVVDPDGDGVADWNGWTDRYGVVKTSCGSPSLDCVPVILRGVHVQVNYKCEGACAQSYRDHDVYIGGQSAGWNQPVP